jgi:hypothetical protein
LTSPACLHKDWTFAPPIRPAQVLNRMKNVYEVLRQKELELARLEKEVEALRVAAPLLSDEKGESLSESASSKPSLAATATQQPIRIPQPAVSAAAVTAQPERAAGWEDTAKRWP